MTLVLRPYQADLIRRVRQAERLWPRMRVCVQAPTGAGKSIMMAALLHDPVPQIVLTHRRVLLDQLSRVLTENGVDFGIRAAGHRRSDAHVQLAMLQTEYNRVHKKGTWPAHPARRVHVDEIHGQKSKTAQLVIGSYLRKGASLIGWTATPREIGHLCDHLFVAATVPELIDQGYLVPPVVYAPEVPDLDRLERVRRDQNGEYASAELSAMWNPKVIFGSVLEHYRRLNPQQVPTALFAPGVADSLWFAQNLTAKGVPSAHIDHKQIWWDGDFIDSTPENRAWLFGCVRGGAVKVLCNRFVLREGWDEPSVAHIILACIIGTRNGFVQACGRGLRPYSGKVRCCVVDHGGNALRFPSLMSDTPWSMTVSEVQQHKDRVASLRGDDDAPPLTDPEPIVCPKCHAMRVSGPECPECRHRSKTRSRFVRQLDGELKLVTGPLYKPKPKPKPKTPADLWKGHFWGSRLHRPNRTFNEVFMICQNLYGPDFPRELPLTPRNPDDWAREVGTYPMKKLRF